MHGSTGSRPLRMTGQADPGLPVCLTVTHVDALILARSAFHHSINYRSVVVHGTAHQVTDPEEKRIALDALVDHVVPGRSADSRPANAKELAATAVIRLDLDEVSAKVRTGGVERRAGGPRPPPLGRRGPAAQGLRDPRSRTPTWPPAPSSRTTSGPCRADGSRVPLPARTGGPRKGRGELREQPHTTRGPQPTKPPRRHRPRPTDSSGSTPSPPDATFNGALLPGAARCAMNAPPAPPRRPRSAAPTDAPPAAPRRARSR